VLLIFKLPHFEGSFFFLLMRREHCSGGFGLS
jgi:hypothetical protein